MKRTRAIIITIVLIMAEIIIFQGFQNSPGGGTSLIKIAISEPEEEREGSEMVKTTDRQIVNGQEFLMMDSAGRKEISDIKSVINEIYDFDTFLPMSNVNSVNFTDLGTITRYVPAGTLIQQVRYISGYSHSPIIAVMNANTRELLYKEVGERSVAVSEEVIMGVYKAFDVDTFILVSCPKYKFDDPTVTSMQFKSVSYSSVESASIGDVLTYTEERTNIIMYAVEIIVGTQNFAPESEVAERKAETRKYSNYFKSTEGVSYDFGAYGVVEKVLPAGVFLENVEYTVGVNNIYPGFAVINAETRELLYKNISDVKKSRDEVISFSNLKLSFDVDAYVLIKSPKYKFIGSSDQITGDVCHFDSVDSEDIELSSIGTIVSYQENPNLNITYLATIRTYTTYASSKETWGNVITVSPDGSQDYTTITNAVANASNGDTIYIMPGVYANETIRAWGKNLTIIGFDRDSVIIINNTNNYSSPALEMASGVLKHVTILQDQDVETAGSTSFPYCIHIDNGSLEDNTFIIEDCYLDAKYNAAIGIGLRNGGHLIVRNCILKTEHNLNSANIHIGAVFVHPGSTGENQFMELTDCQLISTYGSALHFENVYQGNNAKAYVNVMKCFLWSDEIGKETGIVTMQRADQNVFVSAKTFGNNAEIVPVVIN